MKQNEIVARQNRVVYILLIVVGAMGLTWAIWKHWYNGQEPPAAHATASHPAAWQRPAAAAAPLRALPATGA